MKKVNKPAIQSTQLAESSIGDIDSNQGSFPIVGIGASAGGLEAMELLFTNMPDNSGFAFVIIQHLSPDHKGMLGELLQRYTKMRVYTVTDRMKVEQNSVYVIPSNQSMSILNGKLHLFKPSEKPGFRLPIDLFLRSLAEDQKENSIGIILSGMGSDGSLGLKAIKEKAGLVLVQDPVSAKFDSMPRSAIEAVVVDIVAPVERLPEKLIALTKQSPTSRAKEESDKDTSAIEKVTILLRAQTGNDFSQYKRSTIYRRIERRMSIHQLDKISSYVQYLQENPTELDILFRELLIGVTNFFRDAVVWDELKDNILPAVFAKLPQRHTIRVWVPGCSTGEEAYTMAMIFREVFEKANINKSISVQIFATDLDSNAIDKARKGIYMSNIVADVTPERLTRFFTKVDDHYKVNNDIREMVVFAPQNVIKDPSFTKLDILSCRNLLIYMNTDLQKRLLTLFHYSLNPGGILLLGSSETHGSQGQMYTTINSKLRIYQRSGAIKNEEPFDFLGSLPQNKPDISGIRQVKTFDNLQTLTDQLLLQQFSPASVLVTDKGDILYLTGNIGKYLVPAAGKANMNLFAMAREGIRNELPLAFRDAKQNFAKVVLRVRIENNHSTQLTEVILQQIEKPRELKNKILVIFADVPEVKADSKQKREKFKEDTRESELTFEIKRYKEELESTREEMQTSQEELKSTNEELQSTNEELQSTNEELTTSKEEMQSMNEELQTMNVELQSKMEDSVRVNNDMNNLLNSIEIATLFLDKNMNIRQFTPAATRIFKMKQSDIGRLFTDQVSDLNYSEIFNDVKEVSRTLKFIEKPISARDGRWFNVRIMPYRTYDDKIDGLVITFINITESKLLENAFETSQIKFHSLIETLPIGFISMTTDGTITEFNGEAKKYTGYKINEVIGGNFFNLFLSGQSRNKVKSGIKKLSTGVTNWFENQITGIKDNKISIEWSANKLEDGEVILTGLMKVVPNITS